MTTPSELALISVTLESSTPSLHHAWKTLVVGYVEYFLYLSSHCHPARKTCAKMFVLLTSIQTFRYNFLFSRCNCVGRSRLAEFLGLVHRCANLWYMRAGTVNCVNSYDLSSFTHLDSSHTRTHQAGHATQHGYIYLSSAPLTRFPI